MNNEAQGNGRKGSSGVGESSKSVKPPKLTCPPFLSHTHATGPSAVFSWEAGCEGKTNRLSDGTNMDLITARS